MNVETDGASMDENAFKLICDQCGSLTLRWSSETLPAAHSLLTCGRCGAPRGTLQALRERSLQVGLKYPDQ